MELHLIVDQDAESGWQFRFLDAGDRIVALYVDRQGVTSDAQLLHTL